MSRNNIISLSSLQPILILFLWILRTNSLKTEARLRFLRVSPTQKSLASSAGTSVPGETSFVALTREAGNNDKLLKAIQSNFRIQEKIDELHFIELPCIEHVEGPDASSLPVVLATKPFDYVCITSPEAATVFINAYKVAEEMHKPSDTISLGRIAVVGKATEQVLTQHGFDVAFVPSKATAKVLAEELPSLQSNEENRLTTVLYPASLQAKTNLEEGLQKRGKFLVTRLNTYDTLPAKWTKDQVNLARQCKVACFGSPSAVNGWTKNLDEGNKILAACIGETSAEECRKLKWDQSHIFYPEKPGIEGWADAVAQALQVKQGKSAHLM